MRGPRTATKSGPRLLQLEKALAQKWRLNIAINQSIFKKKKKKRISYYKGFKKLIYFWTTSHLSGRVNCDLNGSSRLSKSHDNQITGLLTHGQGRFSPPHAACQGIRGMMPGILPKLLTLSGPLWNEGNVADSIILPEALSESRNPHSSVLWMTAIGRVHFPEWLQLYFQPHVLFPEPCHHQQHHPIKN